MTEITIFNDVIYCNLNPVAAMLPDALPSAREDFEIQSSTDHYSKAYHDGAADGYDEGLEEGREQGHGEGLSEGLAKGRRDVLRALRNLLSDNFLDADIAARISAFVEQTSAEEAA